MSKVLADKILEINYLEESSGSKKAETAFNNFNKLNVDDEKEILGTKTTSLAERYKNGVGVIVDKAIVDKYNAGTTARATIAKARETDNPKEKSELYKASRRMINIGKDSKKTTKHPIANTIGKSLLKTTGLVIAGTGAITAGVAGAANAGADGPVLMGTSLASSIAVGAGSGNWGSRDLDKHVASRKRSYDNEIASTAKTSGVKPNLINNNSNNTKTLKERLNASKNKTKVGE